MNDDGEQSEGGSLRESQRITQVAEGGTEDANEPSGGEEPPDSTTGRASIVVTSIPLENVLPESDSRPTARAAVMSPGEALLIPSFLLEHATQPPPGIPSRPSAGDSGVEGPRGYPKNWIVDGRYQVLEQVGAGGMARIFKVRHLSLGREFALKLMHASTRPTQRYRAHLLREAHVVSQMEHPNVVQVTDFGEDHLFGVFIVMEYLKGETLYDLLKRKDRLRLPEALNIALQVGEALRYMHSKDLIHRDVKPENIFLCRAPEGQRQQPQVKLIDFGLAGRDAKITVQSSGSAMGTPAYMSPEQIRGNQPRPSNDIYAIGVLLYEMLTGAPPFVGSFQQVLDCHVSEEPKPLAEALGDELEERVELLVRRALSKEAGERHRSVDEVLYELRTVMDMLGIDRGRRSRRGGREAEPGGRLAELTAGWMVFEHSPCPMFWLDETCRVRAANPALGRFVREAQEALIGSSLAEGRLGRYYPELADDVRAVAREGRAHQRLITIHKSSHHPTKVLVWLVSMGDRESQVPTVAGVVVPLAYDEKNQGGGVES